MDLRQWKEFKSWKDEMEELKAMIPQIYPQWTDFNIHDPGITLLELFAWFQQVQLYHLRQIGREHKREYLQLLGISPVKLTPAHTFVTVKAPRSLLLPAGARFYAETIPFENREAQMVTEGAFLRFVTGDEGQEHILEGDWLREGRGVSIFPFGRKPKAGAYMEIWLDRPLGEGVCHRLYMEFAGAPGKERMPVDERAFDGYGFYPLAEIRMEYLGETGWKPVNEGGRDGTYGFLQDGSIRFSLDLPMKAGDYRLRFTLDRCDYSIAPCITRISLAMVKVWQQETVREEHLPVFEGTGFPNQLFELEAEGVIGEALELYVEMPGLGKQEWEVPGAQETYEGMREPKREDTGAWTPVEDFHRSGPEDRHYRLEKEGILFGDGIRGLAPEGSIRITRLVKSLGDKGNIKSGTINRLEDMPGDVSVVHEMDVMGGRARESEEEALTRFRKEQQREWTAPSCRAVTFSDYEQLVLRIPGLTIETCRAYSPNPDTKEIYLAVKPGSHEEKPVLTPGYERNIYRYLEDKRMIGTRLLVVSPDYYEVSVVCTVCARVQYRMAAHTVEEEIRRWAAGKGFGEGILYGELLGMIDALPCVRQVQSLGLDGGSRGKRNVRGDLLLPPNGLLHLKHVTCNLMTPMKEGL